MNSGDLTRQPATILVQDTAREEFSEADQLASLRSKVVSDRRVEQELLSGTYLRLKKRGKLQWRRLTVSVQSCFSNCPSTS
jgi:hypothetical protein